MNTFLQRGWRASKPLMFTGQLMLLDLAICLAGLVLDSTTITGQPAWLKPAKFAISVALYCFTLAWILSYVDRSPRLMRTMAWMTSVIFLVEIVIIDVQATRGTTSHFNVSTLLDSALFISMGVGIGILWICSIVIAIALVRTQFEDRSWGMALKLGLVISIVGSATGGFMTAPTATQLKDAHVTHKMPVSGSHTVGAPDGGPGLPMTGWSTEHGDVRVPHFLGMHAMQILPLIAWFTRRRRTLATMRAVQLAGASYFGLFAILTWQALRGQSVIEPDSITFMALGLWAAASLIGVFAIAYRRPEMKLATGHQ
jgi:hypothetical protein